METKLELIKEQVASIKTDVVEIKESLSDIKVTMGINTKSLEVHIKRTDDLQLMVEEFKSHMIMVNTAIKVIIALGAVIAFLDKLGIFRSLLTLIN